MEEWGEIFGRFAARGDFVDAQPYGEGHINTTFCVTTTAKRYILQKINTALFADVDKLMRNIRLVTEFNRAKIIERGGDPERETLNIVPTKEGKPYAETEDGCYRVYDFIENATSYQVVERPAHFREAAVAFGNFASLLAEFDAAELYETIPAFHHTPSRFAAFQSAIAADKLGRAKDVRREIDFVLARERYCPIVTDRLASGRIPTKVTHNDTKLNNVLIDNDTGKGVAVIDLDTVMPGSILYDYGDAIRFGCNPAAEDERNLSRVNFRLDLFIEFTQGYLGALGSSVTAAERELLPLSAVLMTYECGMRFLTDYLDGDGYFKTRRPGQNLDRARTQFKLIEDMESHMPKLKKIVADCL